MGTLQDWYFEIPLVTRIYLTSSVLITAACSLELLSPFTLYFNWKLVFLKGQVWRLFTNFCFFGPIGLDFTFHMFFLVRYCRLLEEGSFRGRTADFLMMLLFGGAIMCLVAPHINIPPFLGSPLAFMMVYVWGRRNEHVRMSFLGLFHFRAPFLPWTLLGFSVLLGNSPVIDLMGIVVGHLYFFCEDVYPSTRAGRGRKILRTPRLLSFLVEQLTAATRPDFAFAVEPPPEPPPAPLPEHQPEPPPPQT